MSAELAPPTDPEDVKIITLARSALARAGSRNGSSPQGACVRDTDGRTYAAASVDLPNLKLGALALAVAMAVSSGAPGLEACAVSGAGGPSEADLAAARDLGGSGIAVWLADPKGVVRDRVEL